MTREWQMEMVEQKMHHNISRYTQRLMTLEELGEHFRWYLKFMKKRRTAERLSETWLGSFTSGNTVTEYYFDECSSMETSYGGAKNGPIPVVRSQSTQQITSSPDAVGYTPEESDRCSMQKHPVVGYDQKKQVLSWVIMGIGGVGKTKIMSRYYHDEFDDEYEPTKVDSHSSIMKTEDGREYLLIGIDTAGQEDFKHILDSAIRANQMFVFAFSLIERETFDEVKLMIDEFNLKRVDIKGPYTMILCGTKFDLFDENNEEHVSLMSDSKSYAEEHSIPFFETSAKDNINIKEMIKFLIKDSPKFLDLPENQQNSVKSTKKNKKKKPCLIL